MKQDWRNRSLGCLVLLASIMSGAQLSASAAEQSPRQYCAQIGNDDEVRPVTASLAGAIKRLFGISGKYALETTYYRCAGGHVMLCAVGANLSCGKADMSTTLPASTSGAEATRIPISFRWRSPDTIRPIVGAASAALQRPAKRSARSMRGDFFPRTGRSSNRGLSPNRFVSLRGRKRRHMHRVMGVD